ncbi:transmembrane protein [Pasteurella canis]|uniref:Transmembrane protein n=1 Tax=Pasteurella canis TaxID=753 RepID=A0A379EWY5_9PAST|nr:hypothetical protein [Pasteurella canis]UDW83358.1 hypothetical protein K7G91_001709 [Pasteurella canis]GJJ79984.1 hypothetical protein PcPA57_07040 [Pasteurella canis]SUC10723.1 transmembrane protein [Pasteurella canis]
MKKILLGTFILAATSNAIALDNNFNLYGKVGVDLVSRFNTIAFTRNEGKAPKNSTHFSPSIFFELTYNATPKTEVGAGLGYIYRKKLNYTYQGEVNNGNNATLSFIEKYPVNRYSSIPLYFLVKHNFTIQPNIKTYIKADFGYAFNKTKSNITFIDGYDVAGTGQYSFEKHNVKLNVENGNYYGIGIGVEYKNALIELTYAHTESYLTHSSKLIKGNHNYNNDALRLSIGYKF